MLGAGRGAIVFCFTNAVFGGPEISVSTLISLTRWWVINGVWCGADFSSPRHPYRLTRTARTRAWAGLVAGGLT